MNLKQLEVFRSVAETGSFSKGAEASFITQSTVSQHISALEAEMGVRLFDRTGKGALLTEAGKLLLCHARKIITDFGEADRALRRFKGLEDATLLVGGSNIPAVYMIPAAIPILAERFHGLAISVSQGDSRDILEKLLKEEIELGIVGIRREFEGLDFAPLKRDLIRLVAHGRHRWGERETVSVDELKGEKLIIREAGSGTGESVEEALAAAGLQPDEIRIAACLGSNEAIKQAVVNGMGVSFLSELSVRRDVERGELRTYNVKGLNITRDFFLATRSGRDLSPAARAFIEVMRASC